MGHDQDAGARQFVLTVRAVGIGVLAGALCQSITTGIQHVMGLRTLRWGVGNDGINTMTVGAFVLAALFFAACISIAMLAVAMPAHRIDTLRRRFSRE